MIQRRLARFALLAALGLTAMPALAGKVEKAEKMLTKYAGTDHVALAKAYDAANQAKVDPKSRDAAFTWVVLAEVLKAYALDPDAESPAPDATVAALDAYDAAIGKDADKAYSERILEGVVALEGRKRGAATEAYEAKAYEEAWPHLEAVMKAHALLRQIGTVDASHEASALKLAILTAVKRNDLKVARNLHGELAQAHKVPTAISLSLATAIAEVEGDEPALAFLVPLSDANPDDADVMAARIEHLLALGKTEDVVGLLTQNEGSVGKALAITLVHARAWDRVQDLAKAADAYAKALELGPEDQEVLRGYADVELRRAAAFDLAAGATRKYKERKQHQADRDKARNHAIELLQTSRRVDPDHLPTLELLLDQYEAVKYDDKEEVQALEARIDELKSKG